MFQKFYENTLMSDFIKQLLATVNIPIIHTCTQSDINNGLLVEGVKYIFNNSIIEAKGQNSDGSSEFDTLELYEIGDRFNGLTTTFESSQNSYDSKTHYYLGQYLRLLRDALGLDLMPFYNCYSSIYLRDIRLNFNSPSNPYKVITNPNNYNDDYKVIAIPIKFNKTYTIAIDAHEPYSIMPIFYGTKGILKSLSIFNEIPYVGYKSINCSQFNKPYTYTLNLKDIQTATSNKDAAAQLLDYEKYLYLCIQIPSTNKSSIVVLEGDYTSVSSRKVVSDEAINLLTTEELNAKLITDLDLLRFSDGNSYAFSDRLIEYLLLNAITNIDDISNNIYRIQNYCMSTSLAKVSGIGIYLPKSYTPGVWSEDLRLFLYNMIVNGKKANYIRDVNGFVDKDTEWLISKGVGI